MALEVAGSITSNCAEPLSHSPFMSIPDGIFMVDIPLSDLVVGDRVQLNARGCENAPL
jgi:hypothetical protein